MGYWIAVTIALVATQTALGHAQGADEEPLAFPYHVLFCLMGLLGAYTWGRRFRSHPAKLRDWCYYFSLAALAAALLPPLDTLADQLISMHMIQHLLIMMVAAPLFALSAPTLTILHGLPHGSRRNIWRLNRWITARLLSFSLLAQPVFTWILFFVVLWIWHIPRYYEAALSAPWIHDLQHISFFLAAYLFWVALMHPVRVRRTRASASVMYLFLASLHTVALGVLLTISPSVWYKSYLGTTDLHGRNPLFDQQLAGIYMWMPACMMYVAIAVLLLARELGVFPQPLRQS